MEGNDMSRRAAELLNVVPPGVTIVAAAKTRTPEEVAAVIDEGVIHVGHNYVQEAEQMRPAIDRPATWHLIGHLQRNKARRAAALFDVIETVDSLRLGCALNRHCEEIGKVMPIYVEVNTGGEHQKNGVPPKDAIDLIRGLSELDSLRVEGVMTMGPFTELPDEARPYFVEARRVFEEIAALDLPNVEMRCLSMGMSTTYQVAIEEGANVVRIGTRLFGER